MTGRMRYFFRTFTEAVLLTYSFSQPMTRSVRSLPISIQPSQHIFSVRCKNLYKVSNFIDVLISVRRNLPLFGIFFLTSSLFSIFATEDRSCYQQLPSGNLDATIADPKCHIRFGTSFEWFVLSLIFILS